MFDGQLLAMKTSFGVFTTLNNASSQYAIRKTLPDSVRALFRAVAMMIPDYS